MTIYKVRFTECEHDGDLDHYIGDIINSGGKIVDSGVDYDNEEGWVRFETNDKEAFMSKFKETDAYGLT